MYTVNDKNDGTVEKTPRAAGNTSADNEANSYKLHKNYLGIIVPETEIYKGNREDFSLHQEKIVGNPIDLAVEFTKEEIIKLLEGGANMQQNHRVLFDVFGMQGMIRLFNHYFANTHIKSMSDLLLPVNAKYLRIIHNLPESVLPEMNNDIEGSPFIAHNILKDDKGELHFIDTDHRPLDAFHPLNLVGNWITSKALNDLKNKKD
ncbi:MAG: hypothetical protein Q8K30_00985 [Candidatus Gracilibacteria bacterium]|nr:hypothetical protein [Candidatus Gracilibacteria bacterium]